MVIGYRLLVIEIFFCNFSRINKKILYFCNRHSGSLVQRTKHKIFYVIRSECFHFILIASQ